MSGKVMTPDRWDFPSPDPVANHPGPRTLDFTMLCLCRQILSPSRPYMNGNKVLRSISFSGTEMSTKCECL